MCHGGEETIIHVLRDCLATSCVWNRVVYPSKFLEFMNLPFEMCYGSGDAALLCMSTLSSMKIFYWWVIGWCWNFAELQQLVWELGQETPVAMS
ncbi:hypothetical protein V6N11_014359 [Hibiscus sabdariffa]|uniref:Reverse transcriptase zinc-binding domain-containing protein n=1 Tax=Hibiscus sabdariffa TaxID=183260 RepID=A0ABR2A9M3_9ROSI